MQLPRLQVDVFIGVVLLQKRQDHDAGQRVAHARVNSGLLNNSISAESPSPHILVVDIYIFFGWVLVFYITMLLHAQHP